MTVLICPNCATRYETTAAIAPEGRKVRCSQCGVVWHAKPEPGGGPETSRSPEASVATEAEALVPPPPEDAPPQVVEDAVPDDDVIFREEPETPPIVEKAEEVREPEPEAEPVRAPPPKAKPKSAAAGPSARAADLKAAADSAVERHAIRPDFMRQPLPAPPRRAPAAFVREPPSRGMLAAGWAGLTLFVGGLVVLLALTPEAVVRALPGAARLYEALGVNVNVRGLEFANVAYDWADDNGRPSLDVKGEIINLTKNALPTPPVLFELRDGKSKEVFQWVTTVREAPIEAGERANFSARIPSPPSAIRSLQLRFAGNG